MFFAEEGLFDFRIYGPTGKYLILKYLESKLILLK
jgi:hypothetical protein